MTGRIVVSRCHRFWVLRASKWGFASRSRVLDAKEGSGRWISFEAAADMQCLLDDKSAPKEMRDCDVSRRLGRMTVVAGRAVSLFTRGGNRTCRLGVWINQCT